MTEPTAELVHVPARTSAEVAMMDRATDSWTVVLEDVAMLAHKIAGTDFVPKEHRGKVGQVAAVILHGRELGLPPMTALSSTYVVHGRPSISAEAMRALILQAGHELAIAESTSARCTIRGKRAGTDEWTSVTWTIDDARQAGGLLNKDTWKSYPRQMLTARATAELARMIFPDVIHGMRAIEEMDDVTPWEGPSTAVEQSAAPATTKVRRQPRKSTTDQPTGPVADQPGPAEQAAPADTAAASDQPTAAPERRRPDLPTRGRRPAETAPTVEAPPESHDTPAPASEAGEYAPTPVSDPAPDTAAAEPPPGAAAAVPDVGAGAASPASPAPVPAQPDPRDEVRELAEQRRRDRGQPEPAAEQQADAAVIDTADRRKISPGQRATIMMHFTRLKLVEDRAMRLTYTTALSGRDHLGSTNELTFAQASDVIKALETCRDLDALEQLVNGQESLT